MTTTELIIFMTGGKTNQSVLLEKYLDISHGKEVLINRSTPL